MMSHWNYRVIEFVEPDGETYRAIHEVYYHDDGSLAGYGENPATVVANKWTSWDDENTLNCQLDMMYKALKQPFLKNTDF